MNYLGRALWSLLLVLLVIGLFIFAIQCKNPGWLRSSLQRMGFLKSLNQSDSQGHTIKECPFCEIINGPRPGRVLVENEDVIVIKDRTPYAPIHYLIIPKKHIVDLGYLTSADRQIAASLLMMAQELSQQDPKTRQFRLVNNNGPLVGQTVFHTHIHFLSGKSVPDTDYTLMVPDRILNEE